MIDIQMGLIDSQLDTLCFSLPAALTYQYFNTDRSA